MKRISTFALSVLLATAASAADPLPMDLADVWEIDSEIMGETRTVLVAPPGGYDPVGQTYPVLYVTDAPEQFTHTVGTIDFLRRQGRAPAMIVVGVVNTDRTRDLTPTNATMRNNPLPTSGGADRFRRFLTTELAPFVESRYSTAPFKVFAGHSFGGLFALHTLLTEPDSFNAYIAVSPSTQWDGELILKLAKDTLTEPGRKRRTLYLSLGDEPGIEPSYERFVKFLGKTKPPGLSFESQRFMDEDHGSVVLRSHYFGLKQVFDGWQYPPGQPATAKTLVQHFEQLSQRLGWDVTPPENLANLHGYAHLQADRVDEALELFDLNLSSYPNSANVFDSYGEALEKSGDLAGAEAKYRRAVELATAANDRNFTIYKSNLDRVTTQLPGSAP